MLQSLFQSFAFGGFSRAPSSARSARINLSTSASNLAESRPLFVKSLPTSLDDSRPDIHAQDVQCGTIPGNSRYVLGSQAAEIKRF
jgi:hypothetical protein